MADAEVTESGVARDARRRLVLVSAPSFTPLRLDWLSRLPKFPCALLLRELLRCFHLWLLMSSRVQL